MIKRSYCVTVSAILPAPTCNVPVAVEARAATPTYTVVWVDPPPPPPPPELPPPLHAAIPKRKHSNNSPNICLDRLHGRLTGRTSSATQASVAFQGSFQSGSSGVADASNCGVTLSTTVVVPPSLSDAYCGDVVHVTPGVDGQTSEMFALLK